MLRQAYNFRSFVGQKAKGLTKILSVRSLATEASSATILFADLFGGSLNLANILNAV